MNIIIIFTVWVLSLIIIIGSLTPEYKRAKLPDEALIIAGICLPFLASSSIYLSWQIFKFLVKAAIK